jgi:hypothetical protein
MLSLRAPGKICSLGGIRHTTQCFLVPSSSAGRAGALSQVWVDPRVVMAPLPPVLCVERQLYILGGQDDHDFNLLCFLQSEGIAH